MIEKIFVRESLSFVESQLSSILCCLEERKGFGENIIDDSVMRINFWLTNQYGKSKWRAD